MTLRTRSSPALRMFRRSIPLVASVVLIMALFGCGSGEIRSSGDPVEPSAADAEPMELVSGNNTFAFDLYQALREQDGNLFYSPYSISLALAMTYAGARGETESQMSDTLHFTLPQADLHPAFNALDLELASRSGGEQGGDDEGFQLSIANSVWGQEGYEFLDEFLNVLAESYGAGVRPTDFQGAPEESRLKINDWVANRTNDRIKDLIPQDAINDLTRLVLANAIYFNADWLHPFYYNPVVSRPFHLLDGREVDVPMMTEVEEYGYAKGDGYQAVDLPYAGEEVSMTILLPDRGTFRDFEETMDAALVSRIIEEIQLTTVDLTMPKFEFESQFRLNDTLETMGMSNAFSELKADFSGMDGQSCLTGSNCLLISGVFHKAFVAVDQEGTEAAAATAVIARFTSGTLSYVTVEVDRPFIFLIRDRVTGTILFVGRFEEP